MRTPTRDFLIQSCRFLDRFVGFLGCASVPLSLFLLGHHTHHYVMPNPPPLLNRNNAVKRPPFNSKNHNLVFCTPLPCFLRVRGLVLRSPFIVTRLLNIPFPLLARLRLMAIVLCALCKDQVYVSPFFLQESPLVA